MTRIYFNTIKEKRGNYFIEYIPPNGNKLFANLNLIFYKKFNYPNKEDFKELARRMEIKENRFDKVLAPFLEKQTKVEELINNSYLDNKTKRAYLLHYNTRRNYLNKE